MTKEQISAEQDNELRIKALEDKGGNRWTKGPYDRMYFTATALGLTCTHYHTGNISSADFNGERLSNTRAGKMKAAKSYIDLKTWRAFSDDTYLAAELERLVAAG